MNEESAVCEGCGALLVPHDCGLVCNDLACPWYMPINPQVAHRYRMEGVKLGLEAAISCVREMDFSPVASEGDELWLSGLNAALDAIRDLDPATILETGDGR